MSSKISDLTDGSPLQATDEFVVARSGTNVKIPGSAIGGGGGSGETLEKDIAQTGHGLAVGDVVRLDGTDYVLAQADTIENAEVAGIASGVADANNFTLAISGYVSGLSGLTAGSVHYLDETTAGALTDTEPSTDGVVSKPLLIADSATSGFLINMRGALVNTDAPSDENGLFFYYSLR